MSTQTEGEIRVEDMPSLEEVVPCVSVHGCNKAAQLRLVGHCCAALAAKGKGTPLLCLEHYVLWLTKHGSITYLCRDCRLRAAGLHSFYFYKEF